MADTDLQIIRGKTFKRVLRYETPPIVWKAISGITQAAPVRLHVPGHGCVDGWRATVESVKGMVDINAKSNPPRKSDYHKVTVVDPNYIEFNDVNASEFKAYASGGYLRYNTPVSLAGCAVRVKILDKDGGTVLASTEAADAPLDFISAVLDDTAKTVTITITDEDTAAIAWNRGVYEIEFEAADGSVPQSLRLAGTVLVGKERVT